MISTCVLQQQKVMLAICFNQRNPYNLEATFHADAFILLIHPLQINSLVRNKKELKENFGKFKQVKSVFF